MPYSELFYSLVPISFLSLLSGILLIFAYIRLPSLRKPPGMLVLYQCLAQLGSDVHWIGSGTHIYLCLLPCTQLHFLPVPGNNHPSPQPDRQLAQSQSSPNAYHQSRHRPDHHPIPSGAERRWRKHGVHLLYPRRVLGGLPHVPAFRRLFPFLGEYRYIRVGDILQDENAEKTHIPASVFNSDTDIRGLLGSDVCLACIPRSWDSSDFLPNDGCVGNEQFGRPVHQHCALAGFRTNEATEAKPQEKGGKAVLSASSSDISAQH